MTDRHDRPTADFRRALDQLLNVVSLSIVKLFIENLSECIYNQHQQNVANRRNPCLYYTSSFFCLVFLFYFQLSVVNCSSVGRQPAL